MERHVPSRGARHADGALAVARSVYGGGFESGAEAELLCGIERLEEMIKGFPGIPRPVSRRAETVLSGVQIRPR